MPNAVTKRRLVERLYEPAATIRVLYSSVCDVGVAIQSWRSSLVIAKLSISIPADSFVVAIGEPSEPPDGGA